jgi:hypothetical protein
MMNAEVLPIAATVLAKPARERALRNDAVSGLYILDSGPCFDNLAETVVPDRDRKKGKDLPPFGSCDPNRRLAHVKIAAIEPGPEDADQHFPGTDLGNRDLFYLYRLS